MSNLAWRAKTAGSIATGSLLIAHVMCAGDLPPMQTATEAVNAVFQPVPTMKGLISPFAEIPTETSVRPVRKLTFNPLRKYFSRRQQKNVDEFLSALDRLVATKAKIPKEAQPELRNTAYIGVSAMLRSDQLTNRPEYADAKNVRISKTRAVNNTVEVIVSEQYEEVGQDRVFGVSKKNSKVILVPENGRWAIDEIISTVVWPNAWPLNGGTSDSSLSAQLADATKQVRDAMKQIEKFRSRLRFEVRPAVKASER